MNREEKCTQTLVLSLPISHLKCEFGDYCSAAHASEGRYLVYSIDGVEIYARDIAYDKNRASCRMLYTALANGINILWLMALFIYYSYSKLLVLWSSEHYFI